MGRRPDTLSHGCLFFFTRPVSYQTRIMKILYCASNLPFRLSSPEASEIPCTHPIPGSSIACFNQDSRKDFYFVARSENTVVETGV